MVRCAVNCWSFGGRASVETKTGSRSFVTEVIVSPLGAENSIFVTRFVGSVKACLCQLLLLVGAIAKAKATAGTVPCSKMWSIQRLIIVHFALSVTPPFECEDSFCFRCTSKTFRSLLLSACRSNVKELSDVHFIEWAQFVFSTLLLGCVPSYSTATKSLNAGRRRGLISTGLVEPVTLLGSR
jgi:hypothetical protein